MQLSKSTVLPIIGLIVLTFFLALSYQNNSIFFEKLLQCSFILAILFIVKIAGHTKRTNNHLSELKDFKKGNDDF